MKKVLFGLIATVFMSFSAVAQIDAATMSKVYKTHMVGLVDNARPYYKDGMTLRDFTAAVSSGAVVSKEQAAVVADVYDFLSRKADTNTIFNNYSGLSLQNYGANHGQATTSTNRCGFWCILEIIGIIIDALLGVPRN